MSTDSQREVGKRRWIGIACGGVLLAIVCYFFPLFRIVPLDAAVKARQSKIFDPGSFAEKFWGEELATVADRAVDIAALVAALASDPEATKAEHGRTMGIGDVHYFHVRGSGIVRSVGEKLVGLSIDGGDLVQVELPTGLIFSNAVRDATGLIEVSDFVSSRHFNEVSSELNRRVETEILPSLREKAAPGRRLSFVGCAEIAGEAAALPLTVIPVSIEFD